LISTLHASVSEMSLLVVLEVCVKVLIIDDVVVTLRVVNVISFDVVAFADVVVVCVDVHLDVVGPVLVGAREVGQAHLLPAQTAPALQHILAVLQHTVPRAQDPLPSGQQNWVSGQ
jgi:hypothetical protein